MFFFLRSIYSHIDSASHRYSNQIKNNKKKLKKKTLKEEPLRSESAANVEKVTTTKNGKNAARVQPKILYQLNDLFLFFFFLFFFSLSFILLCVTRIFQWPPMPHWHNVATGPYAMKTVYLLLKWTCKKKTKKKKFWANSFNVTSYRVSWITESKSGNSYAYEVKSLWQLINCDYHS